MGKGGLADTWIGPGGVNVVFKRLKVIKQADS